uniref:Piwi domain-containing protein n=1 Tax=Podarcis muralis TaxID=64176 RepID=A0A670KFH4_PODMU
MVVRIDVNKDALTKGLSVIGFLASCNFQLTRWYSRCTLQNSGPNITVCLKVCMKDAVSKLQACNGQLPARLIVYRDSIGDGHMKMVVNFEVPQILSAPDESLQNPLVGTVIDTEATRPEWYDFFLSSQLAHQGTVNPTYYNMVYDDNGFKPDHIQHLTYKMCHSDPCDVPAPCQYANKLTFLVGQSIHREPSLALADKLFYL